MTYKEAKIIWLRMLKGKQPKESEIVELYVKVKEALEMCASLEEGDYKVETKGGRE